MVVKLEERTVVVVGLADLAGVALVEDGLKGILFQPLSLQSYLPPFGRCMFCEATSTFLTQ